MAVLDEIEKKLDRIERARKRALRLAIASLVISTLMTVLFVWWMIHRARH